MCFLYGVGFAHLLHENVEKPLCIYFNLHLLTGFVLQ